MRGGIEETSASFEARSAPRSYPTQNLDDGSDTLPVAGLVNGRGDGAGILPGIGGGGGRDDGDALDRDANTGPSIVPGLAGPLPAGCEPPRAAFADAPRNSPPVLTPEPP